MGNTLGLRLRLWWLWRLRGPAAAPCFHGGVGAGHIVLHDLKILQRIITKLPRIKETSLSHQRPNLQRLWRGYSSVSSFCHQSDAATKLLIIFRFIQQSFKNYKTDSLMRSNTWLWPGEYLVGHHYHGCYYDDTFLDDNRELGSSEVKSGCWYSDGGWC